MDLLLCRCREVGWLGGSIIETTEYRIAGPMGLLLNDLEKYCRCAVVPMSRGWERGRAADGQGKEVCSFSLAI
jgi:hypothetical protein